MRKVRSVTVQTDTQGAAANTQLALARDFVVKYFVAMVVSVNVV